MKVECFAVMCVVTDIDNFQGTVGSLIEMMLQLSQAVEKQKLKVCAAGDIRALRLEPMHNMWLLLMTLYLLV
eukprot:m.240273 g.240273  ORF g.240273 m.240273 type:complete len:72 (-) comp19410_c0_seq30:2165-2380(-)